MTDDLLTRAEAAEYLKVSPRLMDEWVRRGTIPAVRLAGSRMLTRISRTALDQWLADQPRAGR